MQEFFQAAIGWLTPIFVISAMLNVGLTQKPANIFQHLRNWQYLARMALVNFVVVPALMIFFVGVFGIEEPYAIGLVIFSAAAGAPLLIKLTARSQNEIAAGATVQMVLMIGTVFIMPVLLPLIIEGVSVDSWAIASGLIMQMILPLALGMVVLTVAEHFTAIIHAWLL